MHFWRIWTKSVLVRLLLKPCWKLRVQTCSYSTVLFSYTYFIRTSKILVRLNALIFWRFSDSNCPYFILLFYQQKQPPEKETLAQEIFKNTCFTERQWTTASAWNILLYTTYHYLPLEYFKTTLEDLYFFQLPVDLFLSRRIYTTSWRKKVF